ncbi:MAG: hypothetical protein NC403_09200 [Muribaculaceae bacterium]|nr:hypothetical protein [Muribaculaceae bacterium]
MAKSEAHKQAAATLRRMAAKIDTLTTSEAAQLARIVDNYYLASTSMQGNAKWLKEGKRGRKSQDGKTLAEIMTPTAPADLPTMVSRWAQDRTNWSKPASLMAALAVALVEMGYICGDNQKAMHTALTGAIPPRLRRKFGIYETFSNRYRAIFERERSNWAHIIEAYKEQFKAP